MVHNIEEMCRICLEKPKLQFSLHKKVPIDEGNNILISEILKYCGNIEVLLEDRKPQNACFPCIENAKVAYKFKLTCTQSEITLNTELLNQCDSLQFINEDNFIDIKDEEISNIKDEKPNITNAEVSTEEGEESDDSFNNYEKAEREESNYAIENNDDDIENVGKTEECKLKCLHCDKSFKYRSLLQRHLRSHDKSEKKCLYCDFKGRGIRLGMHMDKNHDDHKTIQCPDCDRRFFHQINLTKHMVTHKGVKDYICDVCGMCFGTGENLNTHRRIHTGEKPYKCDTCGSAFTQQSTLHSHEIMHSKEPKFTCELCGKMFLGRSGLRRHMLAHADERPFPCSLCDKKFYTSNHRNRHMNIHTGEQTFKCNLCSKEFNAKSSLGMHVRTHTGEKPHICEVCGKAFTQAFSLRSHKASFHPDT